MAIARYTDSGGGGTGKKATYSTQKRTYATYGKSKPLNYSSQYGSNWAKSIQYPNQNNNKPNIPGVPQKLANQTTTLMNQGYSNKQVQPDRWAKTPQTQQYQNNYAAMLKKQQQQSAYDKWITRNRELRTDVSGAPMTRSDGYNYFLPGGGYVPEAMNAGYNNKPSNYGNSYAGGGWGDYGGYGGGGGGYAAGLPEWYLSMTTWKV